MQTHHQRSRQWYARPRSFHLTLFFRVADCYVAIPRQPVALLQDPQGGYELSIASAGPAPAWATGDEIASCFFLSCGTAPSPLQGAWHLGWEAVLISVISFGVWSLSLAFVLVLVNLR
jgi:hypothetical protein